MANGLIDLQTDLKSLRYGSDKPYITKNIGQAPGSQLGLEVQTRIDDTSRIAQMLIDKPGIKYLLNEALLNQASTDMSIAKARKDNKSIAGAVLKQVKYTAQLLGSTLAQVPVNGTGLHFLKGFRTDTYLQNETSKGFAQFFGAGGVEGAQYALRGEPVPGAVGNDYQKFGEQDGPNTFTIDPNISTKYGYNKPVFTDRNETKNTPLPEDVDDRQTKLNAESGTLIKVTPTGSFYDPTTESLTLAGQSTFTNIVSDEITPRKKQEEKLNEFSNVSTYLNKEKNLPTFNKDVTKEFRIKLGDQGARQDDNKRTNKYWFASNTQNPSASLEIDQINALAPQDSKVTGEREGRDIVKFRFHILTPDQTGDGKVLYFRAFLDSFNDNYTGTWNPIKYLGRAEDFQVYGGFQRKISLSFKIAAATRSEMKPLYQKMIWLASATAPTYTANKQFMRGTIVKMTVGDYVYELPGVLNSLTYTWQQDYPWEIAMLEPEGQQGDGDMQELPMVMDCQLDFTPIHTFTPETGLNKFFTAGTRPENTYV